MALARAGMGDIEGAMQELGVALATHDRRWKGAGSMEPVVSVVVSEQEGMSLAQRSISRAMAMSGASLPAATGPYEPEEDDASMAGGDGRVDAAGPSELAPVGSLASSVASLQRARAAQVAGVLAGADGTAGGGWDGQAGGIAAGLPPINWEALSCMPSVVASLRKTLAPHLLPPVIKARFRDDIDARLSALGRGELGDGPADGAVLGDESKRSLTRSMGALQALPSVPGEPSLLSLNDLGSLDGMTVTLGTGAPGVAAWGDPSGPGGRGADGAPLRAGSSRSLRRPPSVASIGRSRGAIKTKSSFRRSGPQGRSMHGASGRWSAAGSVASPGSDDQAGLAGPGTSVALPAPSPSLAAGRELAFVHRSLAAEVYGDVGADDVDATPLDREEVGKGLRLRRCTDFPPDVDALRLRGVLRRRLGDYSGAFGDFAAALRIEEVMARANGWTGARAAQRAGDPDLAGTGFAPDSARSGGSASVIDAAGAESPGLVSGGDSILGLDYGDEPGGRQSPSRTRAQFADGSDDGRGGSPAPERGAKVLVPPPPAELSAVVGGSTDLYTSIFGRPTQLDEALEQAPGTRSPEQCSRIAAALTGCSLVRACAPATRRRLCQQVRAVRYAGGELMTREGEDAEWLGILVTGMALVKVSVGYTQPQAGPGSGESTSRGATARSGRSSVTPAGSSARPSPGGHGREASAPEEHPSASSEASARGEHASGADGAAAAAGAVGDEAAGQEPGGHEVTLEELVPGDTVNELALLWGQQHATAVVAETAALVVQVPASDFFVLGVDAISLQQLEERKALIRRSGAFPFLSEDDLLQLATVSRTRVYHEGDVIVAQASLPAEACLLSRGMAGAFRFSDELASINTAIRRLADALSKANYGYRFHHNMLPDAAATGDLPVIPGDIDADADSDGREDEGPGAAARRRRRRGSTAGPGTTAAEDDDEDGGGLGDRGAGAAALAATITPEALGQTIQRRAERLSRSQRAYPLRMAAPWERTAVHAHRRQLQRDLLAALRRKLAILAARETAAAAEADAEAERRARKRRLRDRALGTAAPKPAAPEAGATEADAPAGLAPSSGPDGRRRSSDAAGSAAAGRAPKAGGGPTLPPASLGARILSLFPPSLFAEQALTDPVSGFSAATVVAETLCEVVVIPKHKVDPGVFTSDRREVIEAKAPVYPGDDALRARQTDNKQWEEYKAALMARVDKRKWPVDKLRVRHLSGGRSVIVGHAPGARPRG